MSAEPREFIIHASGRSPFMLGYSAAADVPGFICAFCCQREARLAPKEPSPPPTPARVSLLRITAVITKAPQETREEWLARQYRDWRTPRLTAERMWDHQHSLISSHNPDVVHATYLHNHGQFRGRAWFGEDIAAEPGRVVTESLYLAGAGQGTPFDYFEWSRPPHPFDTAALVADFHWRPFPEEQIAVPTGGHVGVKITDGGIYPHKITMLIQE